MSYGHPSGDIAKLQRLCQEALRIADDIDKNITALDTHQKQSQAPKSGLASIWKIPASSSTEIRNFITRLKTLQTTIKLYTRQLQTLQGEKEDIGRFSTLQEAIATQSLSLARLATDVSTAIRLQLSSEKRETSALLAGTTKSYS